ncbi:hypothetical protein HOE22_09860 [Candidatus Woesearchaeota archaeon]|jgi:hypothetical protein|nr:hypothetical protein [Candidatus Woesearchaeota archaeon]MBT4731282.1 hypothetical protein [Candidatus Woesearchaeota archaeon]MBT7558444.1 hypothetical protein [Candidatus Woesearchaeota archaeon]
MKENEIIDLPNDSFMSNETIHFEMPHMTLHFTIDEWYLFMGHIFEVSEAVDMVMNKDNMAKS